MDAPLVSVVIPVFNDGSTVSRAVESVLGQTLNEVEVILVDDASVDDSGTVCDRLQREHPDSIRVLHNAKNMQSFESRRIGLSAVRAEFVTFLDADDCLDAQCLERAAALVGDDVDIVAFPIVPVYQEGAEPAEEVLKARAAMYDAPDLIVEGPDIVHASFKDSRVAWSLVGKLYRRELLERAFSLMPSAKMFQSEDAYNYFVIASLARKLLSAHDLPPYRYCMGTGDTCADRLMDAAHYESVCRSSFAADAVSEYLKRECLFDKYGEDYASLRRRLLADPVSRFPHAVLESERAKAFDGLLASWPASEAIALMAEYHWADAASIIEAVSQASSLVAGPSGSKSVAIYTRSLNAREFEGVARQLAHVIEEAGYSPFFIVDEGQDVSDAPAGLVVERIVGCFESVCENYGSRAARLEKVLRKHGAEALVYAEWLSPTLPWDCMLARSVGCRCVLYARGTFYCANQQRISDMLRAPQSSAVFEQIVCPSGAVAAFWNDFNDAVSVVPDPLGEEFTGIDAALTSSKDVLWVGRIDSYKGPIDAIEAFRQAHEALPDIRLKMVGPIDAAYRKLADDYLRASHLDTAVDILGPKTRSEIAGLFSSARAVLITSGIEGFGLSIAEAQACGLPVVTYDMGELSACEGWCGILRTVAGDVSGLADLIRKVMCDDGLAKRLGSESKSRAEELAAFDQRRFWSDLLRGRKIGLPQADPKKRMWSSVFDHYQFMKADFAIADSQLKFAWDALLERDEQIVELKKEIASLREQSQASETPSIAGFLSKFVKKFRG